jgi:hypothetical protein
LQRNNKQHKAVFWWILQNKYDWARLV